jgi:hypothetical protein
LYRNARYRKSYFYDGKFNGRVKGVNMNIDLTKLKKDINKQFHLVRWSTVITDELYCAHLYQEYMESQLINEIITQIRPFINIKKEVFPKEEKVLLSVDFDFINRPELNEILNEAKEI